MVENKYAWVNVKFDEYIKRQADELKKEGFDKVGTATVTRLLHDKVIVPNNIQLKDILRPTLRVDMKKTKKNGLLL